MSFNAEIFQQELQQRKKYIDTCLENYLGGPPAYPPVIHQAMYYAVMNGGKRLRPILVLEGTAIAGGKADNVMPVACAIEMIHSYSLVHDDLPAMDNDDFRRGKPTCHRVFGEANAILTGDALLTAAFELMTHNTEIAGVEVIDVIRVIQEIAHAVGSQGMIGGQVLDLACSDQEESTDLIVLHGLKTGELFKASLRAGAILSRFNEEGLQALTRFATHFGLAFQITDDILDVSGDQALIGKPVGSDAKNVRTTYTSLYGLEGAQAKARQSIEACLDSLSIFASEAEFLRNLARYVLSRTS